MPAFHCVTAVEPIVRAGYTPLFYKINEDLSIDYEDLCAKLSSDIAAVVVINYFGFPADIEGILALREKYDYYVIDDWAHSFLDAKSQKLTGDKGDMAIFSFRKLVPSYAGGGLRINSEAFTCGFSYTPIGSEPLNCNPQETCGRDHRKFRRWHFKISLPIHRKQTG